ncbi:hypothetical protein MKX01_027695 [Papaver californicum]|nr:hypothetical protein MKX01_027695 [Papaver californicum]
MIKSREPMDIQRREHPLELNESAEQLISQCGSQDAHDTMRAGGDFSMSLDFGVSTDFVFETPKLGMVFQSDNHAYEFYYRYAKSLGFSVRKNSSTHRANKTISRRVFCCSKEGYRCPHSRGPPVKSRPKTRTDCKARLVIKLQDDGRYSVVEFIKKHNHELSPPSEVHNRSQQKLPHSQAGGLIEDIHLARIGSPSIYSCPSLDDGGAQDLNFMQVDCNNYLFRRSRNEILEKGDAQFLLDYFKKKQKDDPYFFYAIRMDSNNQLSSSFWCDAKSRVDYSFFSDMVCFDTTYKLNDYNKPYASFIGVNNHGKFIIFGCALILDVTAESLVWLFRTFSDAMNGKQPKTVFTDPALSLSEAIRQVWPNTHHRLGLWYIYEEAKKHLTDMFENFKSFKIDFESCIYKSETEEEFQSSWNLFIGKYNLVQNEWLQDLYHMREKWGHVYGREYFCAGLSAGQGSEGMNKFLKKYFKRTIPLREFVVMYEKVLMILREKEKHQDSCSRQTKPVLHTMWPAEARASERYTRKVFLLFQEEYVGTLDLFAEVSDEDGTNCTYKVSSFENVKPCIVIYDSSDNTVKCSCKKFEFMGILCAHALKVLHSRRLLDIPLQYYLNRWTKDARSGAVVNNDYQSVHLASSSPVTVQHNELAHMAHTLAVKGSTSEKSSAFAKRILKQALEEIDIFLEIDFNQRKSLERAFVDEETVTNHVSANITSMDVPWGKTNGR